MINFIDCDDNDRFLEKSIKLINNQMMKSDIEYRIHIFHQYDEEFFNLTRRDIGSKIYMLDIEVGEESGLDVARYIRESCEDWRSLLVIVTGYNQYKLEALSSRLYLLDFINKLDDCNHKLEEVLEIIMKMYGTRNHTLSYEYNYTSYQIEYNHIIYVEKEQDSKRCLVRTTYGDEYIGKTLNEVARMLSDDKRFSKVSRSMVVNKDHIKSYNSGTNELVFDNGEIVYEVSRNFKKELRFRDSKRS